MYALSAHHILAFAIKLFHLKTQLLNSYSPAALMIFWLFLKFLFLYGFSFLFSVSIYFYLNRRLLPPHRTLQFPLIWREGEIATVELEKGQRLGGNFYLRGEPRNYKKDEKTNFPVIQSNVPYDISLLLNYPDRPEIADLGNLKVSLKLFRKDGKEAGTIEGFRALRYESKILRICRGILSLPVVLWKDSGSERVERISLVKRLVDESNSKGSAENLNIKNDFGFDSKKEEITKNSINRLEISIDPLPPLHSLHLEILANLSPLQHFLFYWRVPAAVLIIGSCTLTLWLLVSFYAFIEVVKIILNFKQKKEETEVVDLSEAEEFKQILEEAEETKIDDTSDDISEIGDTEIAVSIQFPQAESVANFIGDLRQRKLKSTDEDDAISIYNSDTEDQSVPSGADKEE
jgi:hypothetical protein